MFIDAGYDGDLMAAAGISYRVGRERASEFDESWAGILIHKKGARYQGVDPYVKKGQPSSGLLEGIEQVIDNAYELNHQADPVRLQSYNYRLSLTQNPDIKIPFHKPDGYSEASYELLFRYIERGYNGSFFTTQLMPNGKTDSNANGAVSTDLMGGNYDDVASTNYADDGYEQREAIAQKHKTYQQGFFWTLANHRRIPIEVRNYVGQWGYAEDEWASNDHWPYETYIRESRRMRGVHTMTQSDIQNSRLYHNDSVIGLGCYSLDVHELRRVVINDQIYDEGQIHAPLVAPYTIPFGSIIPHSRQATNFLNPVTLSSTHVALSSIRMEPTYMILGQSAATAAVLAIEQGVAIQDVGRRELSARLEADDQILTF